MRSIARVRAGQVVVGQQARQRHDSAKRRPVAEALERGRDRHPRAAHRRVALAAHGDDASARPRSSVICSAAKRMVLVLSEPARPRSVVSSTIARVPPSRLASSGWSSRAEHRGQVGEDLVDLVGVGPRLERRVLGALQLRRSHELHRPGDLLDVADRRDAASDLALAGHWRLRLAPRRANVSLNVSVASLRPLDDLVGRAPSCRRASSSRSARSVSRKR